MFSFVIEMKIIVSFKQFLFGEQLYWVEHICEQPLTLQRVFIWYLT